MARFIMRYRGYNFVNKDPIIDEVRTILQDEGLFAKNKRQVLHELTGVSVSTFDSWFEGDTKEPKNKTVMATLGGLGYERKWTRPRKFDLDSELEVARAWMEKQEKARERFKGLNGGNGHKRAKKASRRITTAVKAAQ